MAGGSPQIVVVASVEAAAVAIAMRLTTLTPQLGVVATRLTLMGSTHLQLTH